MNKKPISVNLDNLPSNTTPSGDNSIIIDTDTGLKSIAIDNIKFKNYNTQFGSLVDQTEQGINNVYSDFVEQQDNIQAGSKFKEAIVVYYKNSPDLNQDFVIINEVNKVLPVNHLAVNTLEKYYTDNRLNIFSDEGILLPPGTYRVHAAACFSVRNPGKYFENNGIYLGDPYGCAISTDIAQLDSPQRSMIVSDIKHIPAESLTGKTSITSTIDGYFNICKTARVGLRVSTDGNICIGDGSLATPQQPRPEPSTFMHYNGITYPIQIMLELISQDDIFGILGTDLTA